MKIYYDSRTGNVKRFIHHLQNVQAVEIEEGMMATDPFILVTYTTGFGKIPDKTVSFLKTNYHLLQGVAASGNRNWGDNFAISADKIVKLYSTDTYNIPILLKFELSGTKKDRDIFMEKYEELAFVSNATKRSFLQSKEHVRI